MIKVTALHARYPGKTSGEALRGFNLEVRLGRIYALLGPNGAGKTTLLRCLTGLLRPASGSLQILGTEIAGGVSSGLLKRMGVMIESPAAYSRMTAMEYLRFFAGFYSDANPLDRIEELAEAFELESLSVRIGRLSQGNRRKVQIMRSVIHEPDLVLWDEPTEHLDPRAQRLVFAFLRKYMATGASALITSHRLEQMQEMADDYGFLRHGVLVHSLSREDLSASLDEAEIEGAGELDASVAEALSIRFDACERLAPGKSRLYQWGFRLRGRNMLAALPDAIKTITDCGGKILRVEPRHHSLESLYRHYVEDAP